MEKEVYRGKFIRVTEEEIQGITWERAYLPDGVIIFPINEAGKVLMIREKRPHETPTTRIKAVSGVLEYDKGTPEENAQRELQEEIGFKALHLEKFMELKGTGTISNTHYFFKATGLIPSKLPNPDGEDTIMEVITYDFEELLQKLLTDEVPWSMSTLGFMRLYHSMR